MSSAGELMRRYALVNADRVTCKAGSSTRYRLLVPTVRTGLGCSAGNADSTSEEFSCYHGTRIKHPRNGNAHSPPCPAKSPFSLSALVMAKLIPWEGVVIKLDPAAASRKRALYSRAAEQPTRGSASGRAQPGAVGCNEQLRLL